MRFLTPSRNKPGRSRVAGRISLCVGLGLWTLAQTLVIWGPLWNRHLLPEADDSQAYLVRTQVLSECYLQDCPALEDLKEQREIGLTDPKVFRAHELSSFPFPFYHPLFSLLILGVKTISGDITTAYRILWTLSPLFFGTAFACLLTSLWGRSAAGFALGLLAFKIFPDTGLHYLTPSNLAMGLAVIIWARIIARRGDALWSLFGGSMLLMLIHPIGVIYALMAMTLAFVVASRDTGRKVGLTILGTCLVSLIAVALTSLVKHPPIVNIFNLLDFTPSPGQLATACASNIEGIVVGISRLKDSLMGEPALLLSAATMGVVLATPEQSKSLKRVSLIYAVVLLFSIYPTHAVSPAGDLFFRLWIPLVVIIFGAVGNALAVLSGMAWEIITNNRSWGGKNARAVLEQTWPVPLFALLIGFAGGTALTGGEHLSALSEYMRNRQALSFDSGQVATLLSQASPSDRVLYTATMPMQFFFMNGTMQLGAVYYHPSYAGTTIETEWTTRPELRFGVSYNPLVYHPQLEGLDEKDQCISSPDYRFSPLSNPRRYGPILKEGAVPLKDFKWLDVHPTTGALTKQLKLFLQNPGDARFIQVVPIGTDGSLHTERTTTVSIAPRWAGWVELDLHESPAGESYRLIPPQGPNRLALGGITFGDTRLHWPWEHKAQLTLSAKDPATGQVSFSFDPVGLVPRVLAKRSIVVIGDGGSSVLLGIGS
jgi:hypothetical protein